MEDTIQHHGVKGMKWGIRKKKESPKEKQQRKDDYKRYTKYKKASRGIGNLQVVADGKVMRRKTAKRKAKELEQKYPNFKKKYFASKVGKAALTIAIHDTMLYGDPLHTAKFYGGAAKLGAAYVKGNIKNRPKFDKSIALPKPKNRMVYDNDTGEWIKRKF